MESRGAKSRPIAPRVRSSPLSSHEAKVLLLALAGGAPGVAVAVALLASANIEARDAWTLGVLVAVAWLSFALILRGEVVRALRTIENVVSAVREGDYSFRGRRAHGDDALSGAMREINALGSALREQRLGAMEASALLDQVMAAIDVAVFAFDDDRRLRLANPAAVRLLGENAPLGATATSLGLASLLDSESPRTV